MTGREKAREAHHPRCGSSAELLTYKMLLKTPAEADSEMCLTYVRDARSASVGPVNSTGTHSSPTAVMAMGAGSIAVGELGPRDDDDDGDDADDDVGFMSR